MCREGRVQTRLFCFLRHLRPHAAVVPTRIANRNLLSHPRQKDPRADSASPLNWRIFRSHHSPRVPLIAWRGGRAYHYQHLGRGIERIPKGFRNKAQGCEERATLGPSRQHESTPTGLRPWVATAATTRPPPRRLSGLGLGRGSHDFLQAPASKEAQNLNLQPERTAPNLVLGAWSFSGAWMLVLGAFPQNSYSGGQ